jgi:hypothetical protein
MKNTTSSTFLIGLALGFVAAGCGSNLVAGESPGAGGGSGQDSSVSGGMVASGGIAASGGITASGGAGGAVTAGGAGGAYPQPVQVTSLYIPIAPVRQLDLVFMIDNSPSMAPKQAKLQANFPSLIDALKDPTDGTLPDLRVAIIDSDLGTAGNIASGACGPNQSNGNDVFGDAGKFRMIGATSCGMKDPNALWIDYQNTTSGVVTNFNSTNPQTDISTVFTCLAGGLGTSGCGFEHQLQAFEFALRPGVLTSSMTDGPALAAQQKMIRPSAYLGLVFLSDEDDCSAAPEDGMFSSSLGATLANESASLRCATRAHQCGGTKLTGAPPAPGYPTTAAFAHAFSDCAARTDSCPNQLDGNGDTDTSAPTTCSPLRDIHNLANAIKSLKADPNQIFVAGIFGLPLDSDPNPQYKIDKIFNQNTADTAHPTVFDYWPICYDPTHPLGSNDPTTQAGYQASVAWGATGGLRMSAFVDEFGPTGLKYSICQPDYSAAMSDIGAIIAKKVQNLCVNATLLDADLNTPGLQPDCRVAYAIVDSTTGIFMEQAAMPQCDPTITVDANQPTLPCWKLTYDTNRCPGTEGAGVGQIVNVVKDPTAPQVPAGTKLDIQCLTCPDVTSGGTAAPGCASTGGVTNTAPVDAAPVGAGPFPVGLPCNLGTGDAGLPAWEAIYNPQASECASRLCIKPAAGQLATVDTTALCSSSCSQDSDCSGQLRDPTNPNDNRCASGFACTTPFVVGPICCQKLCVCKDFYAGSTITTPPACQGSAASTCQ